MFFKTLALLARISKIEILSKFKIHSHDGFSVLPYALVSRHKVAQIKGSFNIILQICVTLKATGLSFSMNFFLKKKKDKEIHEK